MMARFRIRAAGGREFTLGTLDAFVRRVHSGDITPYDLVFDGLTGEWSPARAHPAYQLSVDPLVTGGDEPRDSAEAEAPALDEDATTMDLVEVEAPSPDEEKRAFIARMEEERRADPDRAPLEAEVTLLDERSEIVAEMGPEAVSEAPPVEPVAAAPVARKKEPWRVASGRRERIKVRRIPRVRPLPASGHHWSSWAAFSVLVCVGLAGTATVAWSALRTSGPFPRNEEPGIAAVTRAARPIVPTEAAIRAGAYEDFLSAVDSIRRSLGVDAVPEVWLQGDYLANPTAYPGVRDYWERALTFVETVHTDDASLYHDAYLDAAARAGLGGPMLSLRMAGADGDFAAGQAERDSLYSAVWNVARAAVSLHDVVVSLQGRIRYEPVQGKHLSNAPVIEAVGTDPEAQTLLEGALDRVLTALKPLQTGQVSAEGAKARVPIWIENGLRKLGAGIS